MIPVKRIEIVINARLSDQITEVLERAGVSGWTLVRDVVGHGGSGLQVGDGITGISSNDLILTTTSEAKLETKP